MLSLSVHALIGAGLAVAIALVSRTPLIFLTGLLTLFPTFAIYAHLQTFAAAGAASVKDVAIFGLLALVPYGAYLGVVIAAIDRLGCHLAVGAGLVAWSAAAGGAVAIWRACHAG